MHFTLHRKAFAVSILLAGLIAAGFIAQYSSDSSSSSSPAVDDPVRAEHGLVVSAHRLASRAGLGVLKRGGNAIDAATATGFALAVVYPVAGNVGGGGFMVLRTEDGHVTTIDFREEAPRAATEDMLLDSTGTYDPSRSRRGPLASGVPGTVAGLLKAHERYGTLSREAVLNPAIRLAAEGFRLSRTQAERFNAYRSSFDHPGARHYFTKPDTTAGYQTDDRFVQEDLAAVLRRVRDEGRSGFYQGRTADLIAREMERTGGLITHGDLRRYHAIERRPVTTTYRGYRMFGMPPPSSGGVAVAQLLNAVEPHDIDTLGYNSSATVHLMGEAMRRVYADRAKWLGDMDYYPVPLDGLISKDYMRERMQSFDPQRASVSDSISHGNPMAHESSETTHYSVVDSVGNAVSVTTTLNGGYGSKLAVRGAGFFMNNEMDDFVAKPGVPNMYGLVGGEANAVEPGKRMLSSMSPTILEDPQGRLFMAVGSPGGSTIITTVFQIIMNVVDHGMNIQTAINAPRVHHQWLPDVLYYERWSLARDVQRNLRSRGWNLSGSLRGNKVWGSAQGLTVRHSPSESRRVYFGGADPRRNGVALGY